MADQPANGQPVTEDEPVPPPRLDPDEFVVARGTLTADKCEPLIQKRIG
ncbi:hypothetical protein LQ327_08940 [Actinomycetospora endophytica]|uniref:Uncharacterized protein n=1 Tax=Actinomycetospora endophytica TaxID=2291215 RepID=A0ABS8P6E6_9PSEU|nr:hypothetical protein [Actinomycetospora endophytica]MCD2193507.1 hypothetical protein [Actinomycetospora endophytica]